MSLSNVPSQLLLGVAVCSVFLTSRHASAQSGTPLVLPTSFQPDIRELNARTPYPISTDETRTQIFYGDAEVGGQPFVAQGLALRYDGPLPPTSGGQLFQMRRLVIRAGSSDVADPGADFAANLSEPLTTVFDGPVSYRLDQLATGGPEPWEPTLTFQFQAPLIYAPRPGRWLVFEFLTEGNGGAGAGHASLDAATVGGGVSGGRWQRMGQGCGPNQGGPRARIEALGSRPFSGRYETFAPGGGWTIWGTGLAPNSPCVVFLSGSNQIGPGGLPLPFALPGTTCQIGTGAELPFAAAADASGTLLPYTMGSEFAAPADGSLQGITVYHQIASVSPGANSYGVLTTEVAEVTLGNWLPSQRPIWMAANWQSRTARSASEVLPMALAMRLDLQ